MVFEGFPCANPLCLPTPLRTSDLGGVKKFAPNKKTFLHMLRPLLQTSTRMLKNRIVRTFGVLLPYFACGAVSYSLGDKAFRNPRREGPRRPFGDLAALRTTDQRATWLAKEVSSVGMVRGWRFPKRPSPCKWPREIGMISPSVSDIS